MITRRLSAILLIVIAMYIPSAARGQSQDEEMQAAPPEMPPVVTQHQVRVDGKVLKYTATAGYMPMKDEEGELKANIFFIAYELDGVENPGSRPLTFAFNGGPGSSSVWLHLGAIGPRRVLMTDNGESLPPLGRSVRR